MKAELESEKKASKAHEEDSRAKSKVIEGLIIEKRRVDAENLSLRNDISTMYSKNDMIVVTGSSVLVTFLVTFIAVRSLQ